MRYDFDRVIDRHRTGSIKWDTGARIFGAEALPMWVADMDFPAPEPVLADLRRRLDHPVLGYTRPGVSLKAAVAGRMKKVFGWEVDPDWVLFMPGVVPSLYAAVAAFTQPGDGVLIQSPVYPPFFDVIREQSREAVLNRLSYETGHGHRIDTRDFTAKCRKGQLFLLCSPHNPGGRVWTREELTSMAGPVVEAGGVIVSDEIHHELVFSGHRHIPIAALSPEIGARTVTCVAPSKTFNIAGLSASALIIENPRLRASFKKAMNHGIPGVNLLGLSAFEAAYLYGDEWHAQVMAYLEENRNLVSRETGDMAGIEETPPEATFLSWLDCRQLAASVKDLDNFFTKKARVGLNDGKSFGPGGEGFMRLNFACPRSVLAQGLGRIRDALALRS
ncbi:MAG: PatB family C-S lyase [Spirochaetales bacterium]|nr:PatB family C-S lyase [Spirochaetales bacterium]